ncbi:MAG TPA: DinB family protein [Candidatus Micrarchaeia archaeon]|nr:DinB family protein [Candidatus Micrarchaeia archaeon]
MEYQEIPREAGEQETLLAFLRWQRDTLARKCSGLSDEQLRARSVPPSTLSLLGLVRHMADVERGWFARTLGGLDVPYRYGSDETPDRDFEGAVTADVAEAFSTWEEECRRSDGILSGLALDAVARQETGRALTTRWALVHMVEEYSRHNGHADLLRERIDGAVGY